MLSVIDRDFIARLPSNTDGRGFIWVLTTTGLPALLRPLTLDEWRGRTAVHTAYHQAIARALDVARTRFGFAILVDGHSMPSTGRTGHRDPGRRRADVVPGDRDGTSCAPSLSRHVGDFFRARGHSVAFNDPYKGGYITRHHGRPAPGCCSGRTALSSSSAIPDIPVPPIPTKRMATLRRRSMEPRHDGGRRRLQPRRVPTATRSTTTCGPRPPPGS